MMRSFFIICVVQIFILQNCLAADTAIVNQDASFGEFLQTDYNAQIVLHPDGTVTVTGGIVKSSRAAILTYTAGCVVSHQVDFGAPGVFDMPLDGCTVREHDGTPDPRIFTFGGSGQAQQQVVHWGGTLDITGFCKPGTYAGVFPSGGATNLGWCGVQSVNIPASITFIQPLSITNKKDMNFGAMMSPSADAAVILSYDGNRQSTGGGIYLMNTAEVSQGVFTISGSAGQIVNVMLPGEVSISNGANILTVNKFTTSTGEKFTLAADTVDMGIGATLNVPAKAPEGEYSGTYTVMVSY